MDMRHECISHARLQSTHSNQARAAKHVNADTTNRHDKHAWKPAQRTPKTPVDYEAEVQTLHPNTCKQAPHITKTPVDYEAMLQTLNFNTIPNPNRDAEKTQRVVSRSPPLKGGWGVENPKP